MNRRRYSSIDLQVFNFKYSPNNLGYKDIVMAVLKAFVTVQVFNGDPRTEALAYLEALAYVEAIPTGTDESDTCTIQ